MVTLPIYKKKERYKIHPSKIIALGLNYLEHIKESQEIALNLDIDPEKAKNTLPTEPHIFPKTPNVLIGPDEPVVIPKIAYQYNFETVRTDLEAELAIIIKDRCKNVPKNEAMKHILGFTCMNDVSQRNIQKSDKTGWFRGKSFDTFGPIGPQVVLMEDIGDPQNLRIQSRLNGNLCQDSNTRFMIFDIPSIIEYVSCNFTLEEGDIIITGTPKGVAALKEGDIMEIEIENIGILKNPVKMEL
ncbi:hypothetical protein NEF87_003620 [Candidatus Lokiarchaeum ossiferum]|uniref:Fumarylacetoacetase-like C-terminal domain-containing protein n=1 Tax=Candidatus Lokiarchaeum ossiferum TaxID=2951803 RepID=A0ABY6HUY9_9ARCH|nr:hypothetical protein NEF87_003620 [Candidatus Lokiarchaeum sp. B-35]